MTDPKTPDDDAFSAHEVMDRAFLLSNSFDEYIASHAFVLSKPELLAAAAELNEKLAAFYQLAGQYSFRY